MHGIQEDVYNRHNSGRSLQAMLPCRMLTTFLFLTSALALYRCYGSRLHSSHGCPQGCKTRLFDHYELYHAYVSTIEQQSSCSCKTGQVLCGCICTDVAKDVDNCGDCGTVCSVVRNGVESPACNNSVCSVRCGGMAGWYGHYDSAKSWHGCHDPIENAGYRPS